ncbi:MAG: DUF1501 domain-containing protein [Rhodobacteraceae bacterium]|nr:DUF1501 domain-containing protein [Paracoccaceae bacterium]
MTRIRLDGPMSRRLFLKGSALVGCSLAATPFLTSVTLAAAPWDQRLVVIILRGAMDGLDVVRPVGDPAYAAYRPTLLTGDPALPLTDMFALHPDLGDLMPLWKAGELGFAHAVSTPYRDKRSHFDGQDILEAGTGLDVPEPSVRDGWLNRMLQGVPGMTAETAFAVGRDEMKVLIGPAPHAAWAPDAKLVLSAQSRRLLGKVYEADPLFHAASMEAMDLSDRMMAEAPDKAGGMAGMAAPVADPGGKAQPDKIAAFAADQLKQATRIAAFSINGWDTHNGQRAALKRALATLSNTILTLKADLGPVWKKTTVLAMTEFGRTARENGTGGTDHGTGGVMLMAGGAVRGGKIYGRWPGLDDAALFEQRDLLPTADVRSYAAWAMRGLYGLDSGVLEKTIFPGLDMGADPGLLL